MMLPSVRIQVHAGGGILNSSLREKDSFLKVPAFLIGPTILGSLDLAIIVLLGIAVRVHSW
jgi:hypothetical protein